VNNAVDFYMHAGVHPSKLVIGRRPLLLDDHLLICAGMPIYGRAFANTDGINKPFSGE
jgi:hypothetical protein